MIPQIGSLYLGAGLAIVIQNGKTEIRVIFYLGNTSTNFFLNNDRLTWKIYKKIKYSIINMYYLFFM